MDEEGSDSIEFVHREVLRSRKYAVVHPDFVRTLAIAEIGKGRRRKEAVKAVKSKLHQLCGSCTHVRPDYERWLDRLEEAAASGEESTERTCLDLLGHHVSTRERSKFIRDFYGTVLRGLPPPERILDLACGLHPLSIPWMDFSGEVEYVAMDLLSDLVDFLNGALPLLGVRGRAERADVLAGPSPGRADLAFVLKAVPALERIEKGSALRLLEGLDVPTLIVSYPTRTLGGRRKGLAGGHGRAFGEMVASTGWTVDRFEFPTEIVFRVSKGSLV